MSDSPAGLEVSLPPSFGPLEKQKKERKRRKLASRRRATSRPRKKKNSQILLLSSKASVPRDISPGEVVPRVRLRVPESLRLGHHLCEAATGRQRVEDVGERAAEDALDSQDAVARVAEVLERRDDGQAGADGGLVCLGFWCVRACVWGWGGGGVSLVIAGGQLELLHGKRRA